MQRRIGQAEILNTLLSEQISVEHQALHQAHVLGGQLIQHTGRLDVAQVPHIVPRLEVAIDLPLYLGIVRSDDLAAIRQVNLNAVVFFRIVTGGNDDAGRTL